MLHYNNVSPHLFPTVTKMSVWCPYLRGSPVCLFLNRFSETEGCKIDFIIVEEYPARKQKAVKKRKVQETTEGICIHLYPYLLKEQVVSI